MLPAKKQLRSPHDQKMLNLFKSHANR
jgi:hypothetical protein